MLNDCDGNKEDQLEEDEEEDTTTIDVPLGIATRKSKRNAFCLVLGKVVASFFGGNFFGLFQNVSTYNSIVACTVRQLDCFNGVATLMKQVA